MYRLMSDAFGILKLRFQPLSHYRYPLVEMCAVLTVCGMIRAASASWLLGNSAGAVAFAICATFAGWLLKSLAMGYALGAGQKHKPNWIGFVLLTEALILPMILVYYKPTWFAPAQIWYYGWIMLVEVVGFTKISKQSGFKVAAGYLLYAVLYIVMLQVLINVFDRFGWLDFNAVMATLQSMMQAAETAAPGR